MGSGVQLQWEAVKAAPLLYIGAVLATAVIIWAIIDRLYRHRHEGLSEELDRERRENARLKDQLNSSRVNSKGEHSAVPSYPAVDRGQVRATADESPKTERSPKSTLAAPPSDKAGRIFVGPNLTPKKLMSMCEGKTTHQGQRIVQPYLGKWIRVTGIVEDFSMLSSDLGIVRLEGEVQSETLGIKMRSLQAIKLLFKSDFGRLEILQGGERITADGEIERIDLFDLRLKNCEIVSIGADP